MCCKGICTCYVEGYAAGLRRGYYKGYLDGMNDEPYNPPALTVRPIRLIDDPPPTPRFFLPKPETTESAALRKFRRARGCYCDGLCLCGRA